MIYRLGDKTPVLNGDAWVAESAMVLGDVTLGDGSGIWFGCVVRGDVDYIKIGENTNVQDLSMLHVTGGRYPLNIGNNCTLGHRVTVHGCTLKDFAFIGIGATVMDNCEIGEFALVGAGSLVPPGKSIPPRSVAMGYPAKVVREITPEEEAMIRGIPEKYRKLREEYRSEENFVRVDRP